MLEYLCLQMQPHTRDFFNPNFSTRFCKTYITQITQGSLKNLKVLSFVAIPRPCLGAPTKTASRSPSGRLRTTRLSHRGNARHSTTHLY
jgi:hypothetical protein